MPCLPFLASFRVGRGATLLTLLTLLAACRNSDAFWTSALRSLGVADPPPPHAVSVVLLVDRSPGAPASRDRIETTLTSLLSYIARKPGSELRLFVLGNALSSTIDLGAQTSPAPVANERGRAAQQDRFVREARVSFLRLLEPILSSPPPRQSPILDGIVRTLVLSAPDARPRHLIVLSDAREVSSSYGDFETADRIPTPAQFIARARRHGIDLRNHALLRGAHIQFVFTTAGSVPNRRGVVVSADREIAIRTLWSEVLHTAGASEAPSFDGPPQLPTD